MTLVLGLSAVEGSLLLAAAWAVLATWRSASAAWRHLIWTAALAGLLTLPLLMQYGPTLFRSAGPTAGPYLLAPIRIFVQAQTGPSWDFPRLLVLLWAAGVVLFLVRWIAALATIQVMTLKARPATDALLDECRSLLGVTQAVELRYSYRLRSPVVWGVYRPVILLPDALERDDAEQRRIVFLHELAHVQRRDWVELCLTQITAALYWFHPLVWLAVRQVRRERERACDDRVVEVTAMPERYAEQLLQAARAAREQRFGAAIAMITGSELEERIMAILDNTRRRGRVRWYGPLLAGAVTLGLLVPLASTAQENGERRQQQPTSRPSKIRLGSTEMQAKLVYKVVPIYPAEAKRARIQGTVILRTTIGEDGAVRDIDVMSGAPELVQAAADAVRQWRYSPVLLNGEPVAVETTVEVNFTLVP